MTNRSKALVAADDSPITPRDHWLEETETTEASSEGVHLLVADLPWVGWIGAQVVDGDVDDLEISGGA